MLLVGLERCAFYMQTRQLAILGGHDRIRNNRKSMYRFIGFKHPNISPPSLSVQRFYSTNPENEQAKCLSLMWKYSKNEDSFAYYFPSMLFCAFQLAIMHCTDRDFNLIEINKGIKQAHLVISQALATQNYEILNGMVKDRTLKVLKHRVNRLTQEQRDLIAIDPKQNCFMIRNIQKKRSIDRGEMLIEIEVRGVYKSSFEKEPMNFSTSFVAPQLLSSTYTFERRYKNGRGGSWLARIVNHRN